VNLCFDRINTVQAPTDPRLLLDAIDRRRRWKLGMQGGGILFIVLGVVLLPIPRQVGFLKRDLSFFSAIADSGMFVSWGFWCILVGLLALVASSLIRADITD
jgi:hypothetical protein